MRLYTYLVLCGLALLGGCADTTEDITILPGGAGVFVVHADAGREMASLRKMVPWAADTGAMRDVDYSSTLLVGQDTLTTHLVSRPKDSVFTFDARAYISDLSRMQRMRDKIQGMIGAWRHDTSWAGLMKTSWSPHEIRRSFNEALYDSLRAKKHGTFPLMPGGTLRTVFHLPSPVQRVEGDPYTLSDDRKTVTFERKFSDIFKEPKILAFTIDY
jgi:hypothetical protein